MNKEYEGSFDFEISEKSAKKLAEIFKPLKDAHNRFENKEETVDDLLNYYPSFKMLIENNGKKEELDLVKKRYYEKLVDIVKKQNKVIDEMANHIGNLDIDEDICKKVERPLCTDETFFVPVSYCIDCIKQYFEKKVERENNMNNDEIIKNNERYTEGNSDNLERALEGLGQFCHNWCMNCKETKEKDEPIFRCKACNFKNENESCQIKIFLNNYSSGNIGKYTSMGDL